MLCLSEDSDTELPPMYGMRHFTGLASMHMECQVSHAWRRPLGQA